MKILFVLVLLFLLVGVVSADTLVATVSYDRFFQNNPTGNATFSDLRDGVANSVYTPSANLPGGYMVALGTGYDNLYDARQWTGITANTTLPTGSTISATTLTVYYGSANIQLGESPASLYDFYPVNPNSYVVNDSDNTNWVKLATDLPRGTVVNSSYVFTLNNYTTINKTGMTTMMIDNNKTVENVGYPWAASGTTRIYWRPLEYAGGIYAPYYTITYTAPPTASFTPTSTVSYPDDMVIFTDTTTGGSLTSWSWSATNITPGNNTPFVFSTAQNPNYMFGEGNWSIQLNATNALGSDLSDIGWVNLSACNGGVTCTKRAYVSYDRNLNNDRDFNMTFSQYRGNVSGTGVGTPTTQLYSGQMATLGAGYDTFYDFMLRSGISTNTTLPTGSTITSGTLTAYHASKSSSLGAQQGSLIDFTPTNPTSYVSGDYSKTTFTRLADDLPYYSTIAANTSYVFTLNAAGLSAINKTGYTTMMFDLNRTVDNLEYTWAASKVVAFTHRPLEYAGGIYTPFYTITYTTATAPVASFACTKSFTRIPARITCTDTSTNTPTSWSWNMGDGSPALTTQNITYGYTKRGSWNVQLNATNGAGSNLSTQTPIKVTGQEIYAY